MSERRVGDVAVDSGHILIVDPCYALRDSREFKGEPIKPNGYDYNEWLEHPESDELICQPWGDSVGLITSAGYGDGRYPVYATFENGVVTSITVYFDGDPNVPDEFDDEYYDDEDEAGY